MLMCPYCGKELYMSDVIRLFSCKFRLEKDSLEEISKIGGEPFVTVRHTKSCFPFGVRYNSRTKKFRVEK